MSFMFIPERNHDNWCKVQGLPTISVASEIELNEIIHCDRQSPKCDIEPAYSRGSSLSYGIYRATTDNLNISARYINEKEKNMYEKRTAEKKISTSNYKITIIHTLLHSFFNPLALGPVNHSASAWILRAKSK